MRDLVRQSNMPARDGVQRAAPEPACLGTHEHVAPEGRPRPFLSNGCCGSGARLSETPIERTLHRWCVGAFVEALESALATREPGV